MSSNRITWKIRPHPIFGCRSCWSQWRTCESVDMLGKHCPVCFDDYKDGYLAIAFECRYGRHIVCEDCASQMRARADYLEEPVRCPLCRGDVEVETCLVILNDDTRVPGTTWTMAMREAERRNQIEADERFARAVAGDDRLVQEMEDAGLASVLAGDELRANRLGFANAETMNAVAPVVAVPVASTSVTAAMWDGVPVNLGWSNPDTSFVDASDDDDDVVVVAPSTRLTWSNSDDIDEDDDDDDSNDDDDAVMRENENMFSYARRMRSLGRSSSVPLASSVMVGPIAAVMARFSSNDDMSSSDDEDDDDSDSELEL